ETVNCLRNHGASISEEQRHHGPKPYILAEFNLLGYNYRLTDIQAAVGIQQLKKLDRFLDERRKAAGFYASELKSVKWLGLPVVPDGYEHAWQSFVCRVDPKTAPCPRNEIMEKLQERGISTRPGTHAVHMLGYYRDRYDIKPDDFPGAKFCDQQTMAIPLHNRMSQEDYEYVVSALKSL
ncbi:MAG TPA: DegT/DnrJ/EryC1/StrS family aminotransferase, partial [Candidatus Ozemobacteraceae bacterium]|nr:DegT/DnrJ/EryC1/StrS family aminotransferase [Candidatus Ozemobacteraceae bacterium]